MGPWDEDIVEALLRKKDWTCHRCAGVSDALYKHLSDLADRGLLETYEDNA